MEQEPAVAPVVDPSPPRIDLRCPTCDAPFARAELANSLAGRMRNLAYQLMVGWDLEENPDPIYVAYGEAFKEASRRILEQLP